MTDADAERAKYEKVWAHDKYRHQSPGESLVDEAVKALGIEAGDTVIDFGCGTGRPVQKLRRLGIDATGVDFAENCLDPGVEIPFVRACLWDMPDLSADFGFCADVMEHIPRERVHDVLASIHKRCTSGAYFQIATRPDVMGRLIGERLHLTVQPAQWWSEQIAQYWPGAKFQEGKGWMKAIARSR